MKRNNIAILAPCFNESETIVEFLQTLEDSITKLPYDFEVIMVNDASYDETLSLLCDFQFTSQRITLTVLTLAFNVGHQMAILQGLHYANTSDNEAFIIMDSDGQDDPSAIESLLADTSDIIFVNRGKRSESIIFIFAYTIYKWIFKFITGTKIGFGNYCLINRKVLKSILFNGFIHLPSFLSKQRVKKRFVTINRNKRMGGQSKMRFSGLLQHAIRSFIEYAEELLVLCLKSFLILSSVLLLFACHVLYKKIFTDGAILGWASNIMLGLFNGIIILISAFVLGTLLLKLSQIRRGKPISKLYEKISSFSN